MRESKMAAKYLRNNIKKYHTTYILQFVFLVIAIVFNVFIMIIISVSSEIIRVLQYTWPIDP